MIPANKAENVLETALVIHHAEEKIVEDVKKGSTLLDARNKYNYSALQRKDK